MAHMEVSVYETQTAALYNGAKTAWQKGTMNS